jgi:hypothetical protein
MKTKSIRLKKITTYQNKTMIPTKKLVKGGAVPELEELIGEGTHGKIGTLKADTSIAVKVFKNRPMRHESLCKRIIDKYEWVCDEVSMEFLMQKEIHEKFKSLDFPVIVPDVFHFDKDIQECYYIMQRIYPLKKYNKLLLLDMTVPEYEKPKVYSKVGRLQGYKEISDILFISSEELAFVIGQMFSILHFILNIDGYDCELLLGRKNETNEEPQLYLIDYDKVNCFEFIPGHELYRKESEETFSKYEITSSKKMASWLFQSMISMSLLPVEPRLKEEFIKGYKSYFDALNQFELETMEWILHYIDYYDV